LLPPAIGRDEHTRVQMDTPFCPSFRHPLADRGPRECWCVEAGPADRQANTVNQQDRNKETTTPKCRTRRTIPMTGTLYAALKRLETIREGFVVRSLEGCKRPM